MKILSKILTIIMIFFALGCEEKIDELGRVNPNTSTSANDSQVLTSSMGFLGFIVDGDLNEDHSYLWSQYYTWGIGVSIGSEERFVAEPDNFNGLWQRTYAMCLTDLKYLRESENIAYQGVAKVLTAYVFQGLVDHFGDVPYSEANQGEIADGSILTPKFDNAADIYADLVVMLNEAKDDLEKSILDENHDIGSDDLLYGGDLSQWIKFANSLELRILMRTSETDPKSAEVIDLISNGTFIESASDIPAVPFQNVSGQQNPMFAFRENGVGDFYFASNASLNVLNALNDPRAAIFYSMASTGAFAGTLRGIDQGTIDNEPFTAPSSDYSGSNTYAYNADNDVLLMSPWEVWFLRAEAAARYGTSDDEFTAFTNAVTENFSYLGAGDASAYIASLAYDPADGLDNKLDLIAVQKWISLNGTQEDEGWIETRRFDRPASRLFTGVGGIFQDPPLSVLPARTFPSAWLYPAAELSLNPNSPPQRTITDKIFWDN